MEQYSTSSKQRGGRFHEKRSRGPSSFLIRRRSRSSSIRIRLFFFFAKTLEQTSPSEVVVSSVACRFEDGGEGDAVFHGGGDFMDGGGKKVISTHFLMKLME